VYVPTTGLADKIESEGETSSGLRFRILAGIMPEDKHAIQGFSMAWGHRVVVGKWTPKFLTHCATTRFHGEITLIEEGVSHWILNNFKDDIEDWQREELEVSVEELVKPLTEKLKDESLRLRVRSVEIYFENMLNGGVQVMHIKGKGNTLVPIPPGPGPRRPRNRPSVPEPATKDPTGKKRPTNPEISFNIKWESNYRSEDLWRIEEAGKVVTFAVNLCHPVGQQLKDPKGEHRLIDVVTMALCSYLTSRPNYQKLYPFLLNDTGDVHIAMTQNASRWLRHATIV
jgi:hypothetical protein